MERELRDVVVVVVVVVDVDFDTDDERLLIVFLASFLGLVREAVTVVALEVLAFGIAEGFLDTTTVVAILLIPLLDDIVSPSSSVLSPLCCFVVVTPFPFQCLEFSLLRRQSSCISSERIRTTSIAKVKFSDRNHMTNK